jgi:predicted PhzF superfamily epimerase YddE/YHI9
LDYFVLDVFTEKRLEGNALAVVMNPGTLTTERMQAIARETNLSETTFVERRDTALEQQEGVRVRIFTTEEELPFAGHPTLGTASLLRALAPETVVNDVVTLALNVGPVPVRFEPVFVGAWPVRGEMTQRDPEFGEILEARRRQAHFCWLVGRAGSMFWARVMLGVVWRALRGLYGARGCSSTAEKTRRPAPRLGARSAIWSDVER